MDRATFMAALQLASRYGEHITFGGGEPTMNKDFFPFLEKAVELHRAGMFDGDFFMVTNGQSKRKTHRLLDMIEQDEDFPLRVDLSQDEWHDPIDSSVVNRFRRYQDMQDRFSPWSHSPHSKVGIRSVTQIVPVGRAVKTGAATPE